MVGLSVRAVCNITPSFMAITTNGKMSNIVFSLKFGVRALEVIEYLWNDGRYSKFSEKAIELIQDYKVCLVTMRLESIAHNYHNSIFLKFYGD